MTKIIYRLAAVTLMTAVATSTAMATPPPPPEYTPEKLRDAALTDDVVAWDFLEGITTEVGPRPAGTEAEARGRQWALAWLQRNIVANAKIEEYKMPTWIRGAETAEIMSPFPQKMAITALGNSGSTGKTPLIAPIVYFPRLADLIAAPEGSLKGKIAFVSHAMKPAQDGSGYGAFGPARFVGPNIAAKKGAAAIVIRSAGTDYHRNPHTGNTNFEKGVTPIPAGALSIPDAENLERMIKRAGSFDIGNKPVMMKLVLTPQNIGMQTSGNVIAEYPGTDPKLGAVLVACHLDSWDLGTGAFDNAAGCGIIAAAAARASWIGRYSGEKPKRTVRILFAGAEEVGGWGGKAYAEAHKNEPHGIAMESDFGADRVWRVDFKLPDRAKPLADKLYTALAPLGITRSKESAHGGTDIEPIIDANNLAVIDLQQDGTRYFDLHHTPDDTLDKVDKAQLRQNVAAWAAVIAILAHDDSDLSLPIPPAKP